MEEQKFSTRPVPGWLMGIGHLVIGLHFLAIGFLVLGANSGPWQLETMLPGPSFARTINDFSFYYLKPLRLVHNYHFETNIVSLPSIIFEARLKDHEGKVFDTLKFPQDNVNFWVRHRQEQLAKGLGGDLPVQPLRAEVVPAPGKQMTRIKIWEEKDRVLHLREESEHLVPRHRQVFRPNDWSLILARSYGRYLARQHGANSVELVRIHRTPYFPPGLVPTMPSDSYLEIVASFGEINP